MDKITLKQQFDEILNANHKLAVENEELQTRIDKAIEYINRNTCTNVEEQYNSIYLYDEYLNNLLDILGGKDEK